MKAGSIRNIVAATLPYLLIVAACGREVVTADDVPGEEQAKISGIEHMPGISPMEPALVHVRFSEDLARQVENRVSEASLKTSSSSLNMALEEMGATRMERVFPHAGRFEARTRAEGLHRWYSIAFDGDSAPTKAFAAGLASVAGVEIVEEVNRKRLTAYPFKERSEFTNESSMYYLWNYVNTGTKNRKAGADINVEYVWRNITTGSPEVIVSVVDGGIQLNHNDLAWNCSASDHRCFVYGREGDTVYPHEHGTHVAGTIAAVNNNGQGISGVAGGNYPSQRGVTLLSCQIFYTESNGKDSGGNSAAAIKWGADHGAVLCNNSWGYVYSSEAQARRGNISSTDRAAIDYFNKYAGFDENGNQVGPMAGGVVIFASGNESWDAGWPAGYDGCIAVGAINCKGSRASYSNYGSWVDICAPGGDDDNGNYGYIWSTVPNNEIGGMGGTSMACPHVTGVAALLVSQMGGPGFTRENLIKMLLEGANGDFLPSTSQIGPLCDAFGSFSLASSKPLPPEFVKTLVSKWKATLEVKVPCDESGNVTPNTYCLLSTDRTKLLAADPKAPSAEGIIRFATSNKGKKSSDRHSFTTAVLSFGRKYYAVAYSDNILGELSQASEVVELDVPQNYPPQIIATIQPMGIGQFSRMQVSSLDLGKYFKDPENEELKYSVSCKSSSIAVATLDGSVLKISPRANLGSTEITVSVSDGYNTVSQTFTVVCRDGNTLFDAYPNPVEDFLYLRTSSPIDAQVQLYSPNGACEVDIVSMKLLPAGGQGVDCRALSPGKYLLKVTPQNGEAVTKTVVKI